MGLWMCSIRALLPTWWAENSWRLANDGCPDKSLVPQTDRDSVLTAQPSRPLTDACSSPGHPNTPPAPWLLGRLCSLATRKSYSRKYTCWWHRNWLLRPMTTFYVLEGGVPMGLLEDDWLHFQRKAKLGDLIPIWLICSGILLGSKLNSHYFPYNRGFCIQLLGFICLFRWDDHHKELRPQQEISGNCVAHTAKTRLWIIDTFFSYTVFI